jgi:hypothetical protein
MSSIGKCIFANYIYGAKSTLILSVKVGINFFTEMLPEHKTDLLMQWVESITDKFLPHLSLISDATLISYH